MSWASSRALEFGSFKDKPPPPAQWESFGFLQRYYGGLRTLVPLIENEPEYPRDHELPTTASDNATLQARDPLKSKPVSPYPDYTSSKYTSEHGEVVECFLDDKNSITVPAVHVYNGVPQGFPNAVMGSYGLLNLTNDVCFERFGRFGPYGYGYSRRRGGIGAGLEGDREGVEEMWKNVEEVDYTNLRWVEAQERCHTRNAHRFKSQAMHQADAFHLMPLDSRGSMQKRDRKPDDGPPADLIHPKDKETNRLTAAETPLPRTAVIIRTWDDAEYTQEDILHIRSMISELAILSGGEYTIHFLIHVKDDNAPIWADEDTYDRILDKSLPIEFRGMGTLWSERQMALIYGGLAESFFRGLPVHGAYRSTYMPVQYFAHQHPEYDYFWNWEKDIRYTGQWYHLFDKLQSFAREQPRKGLWERNGRFYVPSVHGSWEDFKQMVRVQTEMGTESPNNMWSGLKDSKDGKPSTASKIDKPIWGPHGPPDAFNGSADPVPPTTYEKDKHSWGVGEEADLITLNPLFDPSGATWILSEDVTGYNVSRDGLPERRTAIITAARLSRRLLNTMHRETALAHHTMFSEMWPASCALHHGLKAVYAPHPVYIDRDWPTQYLANVMNAGKNGASGGARTSVFGEREHNFRGTTWYYNAGFSENLWRRWLGYRVDNSGGEEEEIAGEGRMCLPGILLHPVKGVQLVIEGKEEDKGPDEAEGEAVE
ncbi:hypothetical protein MMC09_003533 [Bachmanniomyces sp. S44760]|nr:hypothetical protein [Bachmanniomyces sp. S44760]